MPSIPHSVSSLVTLIDVRTPVEFAKYHMAGAVNIPLHELAMKLGRVRDAARPIVVYCASGNRSAKAAALLRRCGFEEVYDGGGLHDVDFFLQHLLMGEAHEDKSRPLDESPGRMFAINEDSRALQVIAR